MGTHAESARRLAGDTTAHTNVPRDATRNYPDTVTHLPRGEGGELPCRVGNADWPSSRGREAGSAMRAAHTHIHTRPYSLIQVHRQPCKESNSVSWVSQKDTLDWDLPGLSGHPMRWDEYNKQVLPSEQRKENWKLTTNTVFYSVFPFFFP